MSNPIEPASPEAFETWIERRRLDDGEFDRLFGQLGPPLQHEPGAQWDGEDPFAPLPVTIERPIIDVGPVQTDD